MEIKMTVEKATPDDVLDIMNGRVHAKRLAHVRRVVEESKKATRGLKGNDVRGFIAHYNALVQNIEEVVGLSASD